MRGEGKRDPRPADSPGRLRQSEQGIRARENRQIHPWKKGDRPNPHGYNGADWLKQFRDFFKGKTHTSETKTRYMNVLESAYLQALKGKADVISMIVLQMNGKQHSLLDYAEHLRKIEADRTDLALAILGERLKTMDGKQVGEFLLECSVNADVFIRAAKQLEEERDGSSLVECVQDEPSDVAKQPDSLPPIEALEPPQEQSSESATVEPNGWNDK